MQPENGLFACLLLQHAIQNFGACPIFGRVNVLHAVAGDFDADAVAVENGFLREPRGGCAPVELPCVVPCGFYVLAADGEVFGLEHGNLVVFAQFEGALDGEREAGDAECVVGMGLGERS